MISVYGVYYNMKAFKLISRVGEELLPLYHDCTHHPIFLVKYIPNEWTIPNDPNLRLFFFNTLEEAKSARWTQVNHQIEIWECEVEGEIVEVNPLDFGCIPILIARPDRFRELYADLKNKAMDLICLRRSYLTAERIKLTNLLPKYTLLHNKRLYDH
jgi:hypothetical protein